MYLHMIAGSVTTKEWYSFIECGEIIGRVGTSGCSTDFHLHFEPQSGFDPSFPTTKGTFFDPYEGPCSSTTETWWVDQGTGGPSTQCAANPWEFNSGDCVEAVSPVNVRPSPSGDCAGGLCPQKAPGDDGIILDGPSGATYSGTFYVWWKVRWSDGLEGWSTEAPLSRCDELSPPTSLQQQAYNGSQITIGGITNAGTLKLRGIVSSPQGKPARLEVEVKPIGELFNGRGVVGSSLVDSGGAATICVSNLDDRQYHWRARTRDDIGVASPWKSFGNNLESASDFEVQETMCVTCTTSGISAPIKALVPGAKCGSTPLSVSLSATPRDGSAPLNGVDLTATVSGTATGTINYTFYCNRPDAGTDITPGWNAKFDNSNESQKTGFDLCNYGIPGTYTAKVIAERGTGAAEARATITVTPPSAQSPSVSTLSATNVTQGSATFNLSANPNGSSTSVWFDWGTSTSFCCSTAQQNIGSSSAASLSTTIGSLSCDTTYYFRASASNAAGSVSGSILSFRTGACGGGAQTVQLVADATFDAGNNVWWAASPAFYIGARSFPGPGGGVNYAYLSNADGTPGNNLQGGMISPQIIIPSTATSAELRFWASVDSQEPSTALVNDTLSVYLVKPGNQLTLLTTISNREHSGIAYNERRFTVSPSFFDGPIQIFFNGITNGSFPTVFRVDYVRLEAMVATGGLPSVSTQASDQVTSTGARLNMAVNPNNADTEVWFDLDAGNSSPATDTEHVQIGGGEQNENVSISAFGLQCDTLYYFRANASNSFGSQQGSVSSFRTSTCPGSAPFVNTGAADIVTAGSARLNATIIPNGFSTSAWFEWGTTASLGNATPPQNMGSGNSFVSLAMPVNELQCNATYYYRAVAGNSQGRTNGATLGFTTLACNTGAPPTVNTEAPENITSNSMTLYATVIANGASTSAWFEWGTSAAFGNSTPHQGVGAGTSVIYVSEILSGLQCGATYYYRGVAENSQGRRNGATLVSSILPCSGNTPPTIAITKPDGVSDTADQSYLIRWVDSDPDNNATISLLYSINSSCSSPTLIITNIPEDDSANSYSWNTSSIAAGTYYILATISDSVNTPVSSCSSGPVVVGHPVASGLFSDGFETGDTSRWLSFVGTTIFTDNFESQDSSAYHLLPFGSGEGTVQWNYAQDGSTVFRAAGGTSAGGGDSIAWVRTINVPDYAVSARVKVVEVRNAGHHSGIVARLGPSTIDFYELWLNVPSGSVLLSKRMATQELRLASVTLPSVVLNEWVTLKLEVRGNRLRGYVNGQLLVETTEGAFTAGTVGMTNAGSVTYFDDLRVEP
jgi:hypothetical protein